jgi:hypothetical protein
MAVVSDAEDDGDHKGLDEPGDQNDQLGADDIEKVPDESGFAGVGRVQLLVRAPVIGMRLWET